MGKRTTVPSHISVKLSLTIYTKWRYTFSCIYISTEDFQQLIWKEMGLFPLKISLIMFTTISLFKEQLATTFLLCYKPKGYKIEVLPFCERSGAVLCKDMVSLIFKIRKITSLYYRLHISKQYLHLSIGAKLFWQENLWQNRMNCPCLLLQLVEVWCCTITYFGWLTFNGFLVTRVKKSIHVLAR